MDFHSLLTLMVVIWVAGKIFRAINLPVLFGELLGGIIVGPLLLNVVDPTSPTVTVLAELGIFFLMLHTGLHTDPRGLLKATKRSMLISVISIILPFVAIFAAARFFNYDVNQSLFFAIGLSITAIAITARILKDYRIHKTKTAETVMGAAIINDILGLMIFSIIIDIAETGTIALEPLLWMLFKLVIFFGIIIFGGLRLSRHLGPILKDKGFTFAIIAAFTVGLLAEFIGLHLVIGAFLAGLFIREEVIDEKVFNKIEDRIYGLSYSFLGPIFFASLAFSLDPSIFIESPLFLLVIFAIATLCKLIGASVPAFLQIDKVGYGEATLMGLAMNSRGAVDLVIASIGLNMGILDEKIFSMLIFLILATTLFSIFAIKPFAKYAK